ncbi:MAG: hypothetical protein V1816_00230 [Pseudomonadota bacterium]
MKFKNLGKILSGLFLVGAVFLALNQAGASEMDDLKKKAQDKYQKFEEQIQDLVIVQDFTASSPTGDVKSINKQFKKGQKFRIENDMTMPGAGQGMGSLKTIAVSDGQNAYIFSPFQGKQKLPPEQAKQISNSAFWWESTLDEGSLAGKETVDGRDCLILNIKPSEVQPFTKIWLDKDRLVIAKAVGQTPQGVTVETMFSDYRAVMGDFEIPYKTASFSEGKPLSTVTVSSVTVNKGLEDDIFDPEKITPPAAMSMEQLQKMMPPQQN